MQLPSFLQQDADGFIHFRGHRVGLQHVVHYYNEGFSPEMLACEYPSLTLADIHKAIAFYLENRTEVDRYVASSRLEIEQQRMAGGGGLSLRELRARLEATRVDGT